MSIAVFPLPGVFTASPYRPREDARRYYRPELDVLRFFAFFAVFVHHGIYTVFPVLSICGEFGLCLFFFLSAFLITELFTRERRLTGTVDIRAFYVRRVLRIWPLYLAAIVATALAGIFLPAHRAPPLFLLSYVLMLGNVYISCYGFTTTFINFLWSISIEEQFYLVWPLLNRIASQGARFAIVLAVAPLGSLAALALGFAHATPAQGIWTNSFVQFQFFSFGAVAALLLGNRTPALATPGRVFLVLGGMQFWFLAACFSGIDDRVPGRIAGPMLGYWGVAAGCACFLFALLGAEPRFLPRPLIGLGKISYGLYVFHQLSLEIAERIANALPFANSATHHRQFGVVHLLIGFALTVLLASVSYRFYEKPFLRMKERFAVVRSRPA
jgi:peptidoglycan/LPS O-acetylase OafA/YrhL